MTDNWTEQFYGGDKLILPVAKRNFTKLVQPIGFHAQW